jgi:hypothetical protein
LSLLVKRIQRSSTTQIHKTRTCGQGRTSENPLLPFHHPSPIHPPSSRGRAEPSCYDAAYLHTRPLDVFDKLQSVATHATSGACASRWDAPRADSDLLAYGPKTFNFLQGIQTPVGWIAESSGDPQGSLSHRMRRREHMRAVVRHYGPTRIYGPTRHAIGGTAQQALRSLPTAATAAGPRHYQRRLRAGREQQEDGPRRRRWGPRDSHESAVGRLEQLADEGRSDTALRDRRLRDRRRVSPGARDSELPQGPVDVACAWVLL